jgi:beta-lactamase regulating signal transducer with metallopeptidase domain
MQSMAVLAIGGLAATFARRPSMRHAFWTGGVVGSLVLPIAALVLPTIRVTEPAFISATRQSVIPGRSAPGSTSLPSTIDRLDNATLATPAPAAIDWTILVWAIWACGSVLSLAVVMRRSLRVRALLQAARPVSASSVRAEWAVFVESFRLKRRSSALLETDDITAPATGGLLRPRVLLPAGSATWPRDRVRAVLAHELAHVARRDCLTQAVAQVACALYWFSPLHRHAERRMAVERERACDEFVLRAGLCAHAYARALVDGHRDVLSQAYPRLLLAMAPPDKSELEHRVEHILEASGPERPMGFVARVSVVALVASVVVVSSSVRLEAALPQVVTDIVAQRAGEPDQRGDSTARPSSERVPLGVNPRDELVRAALSGPDSSLASQLVAAMRREARTDEDLVPERARWAVSQTENGRLVEPLIARLADPDWRVRAYAAWALGVARDSRAADALVAQLNHPVWRLRAMAAHALQSIGDGRARDAMRLAVDDEAWQVRASAVDYLGALRDASVEPLIRARLSDRHVAVRMAAERALSR